MSYTKGEWTASHPQDNHTAFISDNNFQQKVLMSVQWGSDISKLEQRANAQLIASAPDLYEALEGMLYIFDRDLPFGSIGRINCNTARQALAKARL